MNAGNKAERDQTQGSGKTDMFNNDLTRVALSVVGALILTTTAVGAAVGPATMAEITPMVYAEAAPNAADVANG